MVVQDPRTIILGLWTIFRDLGTIDQDFGRGRGGNIRLLLRTRGNFRIKEITRVALDWLEMIGSNRFGTELRGTRGRCDGLVWYMLGRAWYMVGRDWLIMIVVGRARVGK
jgi:hypothetical protein